MALSDPLPASTPSVLSGEVLRIVHRNDETLWSVLAVCDERGQEVTLVGHTAASVGQIVTAHGALHKGRYGHQFKAESITATHPNTREGVLRYLSSGAFRGIGPSMAAKIVDAFGDKTLAILDASPERIGEVPGIGATRVAALASGWKQDRSIREIMLFFQSQGVSVSMAKRIHAVYGSRAIETVRADPYRICGEVRGIGFKIADAIALRLGVPHDSPQRVRAGLRHVMDEIVGNGHTGATEEVFIRRATASLEVPATLVLAAMRETIPGMGRDAEFSVGELRSSTFRLRRAMEGSRVIHDAWLLSCERRVAQCFSALARRQPHFGNRFSDAVLAEAERQEGRPLTDAQREAVRRVFGHGLSVITGGPGCGKTTSLSVLTRILRQADVRFAFAAPTGKAAQRIAETTDCDASTLHSLMHLRGTSGDPETIDADVVIVDESSMVDIELAAKLVQALGPSTSLVLVGDDDQLPSVGPGRVLGDVIESGIVPTTRLSYIFRQDGNSMITTAAASIRNGEVPASGGRKSDFHILDERTHAPFAEAMRLPHEERASAFSLLAADLIEDLVARRIPETYGLTWRDIMVLSPMRKGAAGVIELNRRLQARINPHPLAKVDVAMGTIGVGDRVMQVQNVKEYDICNGDTGFVVDINHGASTLTVDFQGRRVGIPFADLGDLHLAYATTIHKSQGSESPVVIVPLLTQHWAMLQRNLFYTAVTRARKLAVVVGQQRAIATAATRTGGNVRTTALREIMAGEAMTGSVMRESEHEPSANSGLD